MEFVKGSMLDDAWFKSKGITPEKKLDLNMLQNCMDDLLLAKPLVLNVIYNDKGTEVLGLHVTCLNW